MGDWDDDDFEVDVKQLDVKKEEVVNEVEEDDPEANVPKPQPPKEKPLSKVKQPLHSFAADLGRELTEEEKIEMQKKSDLSFAKDLFGTNTEQATPYLEMSTLEEFRTFGEETGAMLAQRANASHFVDMMTVLLKTALDHLDASKVRQLNLVVKAIADDKSKEEKKSKAKGAAAKPTMKISQKSNAKSNKNMYDEFDGEGDAYDDYDDFM